MKKLSKILTKKYLVQEYIKNKLSSIKIAKKTKCNKGAVLKYMKKFDIPRRTISEATKGIRKSPKTEFKKGFHPKTEFKKGHKLNKGTDNPMSGVHKYGEDAPNWQGGGSFEPYPIGWNKNYKEKIRNRDNHTCQVCGIKERELKEFHRKLSVHHIDYDKENISPENLITLCRKCHVKTNGDRNYWFAYFIYITNQEIEL